MRSADPDAGGCSSSPVSSATRPTVSAPAGRASHRRHHRPHQLLLPCCCHPPLWQPLLVLARRSLPASPAAVVPRPAKAPTAPPSPATTPRRPPAAQTSTSTRCRCSMTSPPWPCSGSTTTTSSSLNCKILAWGSSSLGSGTGRKGKLTENRFKENEQAAQKPKPAPSLAAPAPGAISGAMSSVWVALTSGGGAFWMQMTWVVSPYVRAWVVKSGQGSDLGERPGPAQEVVVLSQKTQNLWLA